MKKIITVLLAFVMLFVSVGLTPSAASKNAPKKITLSKTSKTVYIGQTYKLQVKAVTPKSADKEVTWKTSDKKIATVSSSGVVKGKKKGTVTITAVSKSNKKIKAKCKITVKKYKTKSLDYKAYVYGYDSEHFGLGTLCGISDKTKREDPHIIETYEQLKALKKRIKKEYDIRGYYTSTSPWRYDSEYADKCNGDEILEMLDKYNKKFFKKKVLYYNCIDFTTQVEDQDFHYSFKCTNVEKKIGSNGKITCVFDINRNIKKITKDKDSIIDYDTAAYFIELNKSDVSDVKEFELKHYGYFEMDFNQIHTGAPDFDV